MTFEPSEVFWIEDAETFAVLGDPKRLELLEIFHHPRSVSEAAEILAVPRTRLYHHVKLLEDSGMITVVDTRPAGAMTEKVYRVSAKSYRPSDAFLADSSTKDKAQVMLTSVFGATRADFVRSVCDGVASLSDPKETRKMTLSRGFLRLKPDQILDLIKDLEGVVDRYHEESADEDDPDALRVAFLNVVYPSSRRA